MIIQTICAGKVTTLDMDGVAVPTAFFKSPLEAPWRIDEQGVAGDQRAVHPDALYAYSLNHYDYWAHELGADRAEWAAGTFGENLLFDSLDEGDLRLGDEFQLGDEVRLIVTGPRVPCFKLAWRLGQPKSFQNRFSASGRTGVYFGVRTPGIVKPGDHMRRLHRHDDAPTVRDLAGYCAAHATPPLEALQYALRQPCLSPIVRMTLSAREARARENEDKKIGGWKGWRRFTVDEAVQEAPGVRSLVLVPADGGAIPNWQAGMHVAVRLTTPNGPVLRVWSLSDYQRDPSTMRITVKRQQGEGSRFVNNRIGAGDSVDLRMPSGAFTLDTGTFRPVVLIAAGIGITPLFAMLKAHLARGDRAPPVYLFYGAHSHADHLFKDDLEALAASHPDFHPKWFVSREAPPASEADTFRQGRIGAAAVRDLLADNYLHVGGQRHGMAWHESDFYLCGPDDFCRQLAGDLLNEGANEARIWYEHFSAPPPPPGPAVAAATVHFTRSGHIAQWSAHKNETLLELAEEAGIDVPYSCLAGSCLSCATRITAGETDRDLGDGRTLPCVARPACAAIALDL